MTEEDFEYFNEPRFKKVLKQYEQSVSAGKLPYMDAEELTDVAEYYMTYGREEDANSAIQLALDLHPDSVDPQIFLSRREMFYGNLKQAKEILQNIPDQEDREVKFLKAELLIREGKEKTAMEFLQNVAQEIEEDKQLFIYDCAGVFMDYELWEYAMVWAKMLVKEYPKYKKGKKLIANILVSMGEYEKALPVLQEILDDFPYETKIWNLTAESLGAMERYSEAMEATEFVLAIDKDNFRAKLTRANCCFHMNKLEEAHQGFQELLSLPKDANYAPEMISGIRFTDAVCLASMRRYEEASECLENAIRNEQDATQPEIYRLRMHQAYVESKLHRLDKAIEAWQCARDASESEKPSSSELLLMGEIYLENGIPAKAEEYFRQAKDISTTPYETKLSIALAYGETGNLQKAIDDLQQIIQTFGQEEAGTAIPYLAYFYQNAKDKKQYLHYIRQAAHADKETTEFLFSQQFPNVAPEDYYLYAYRDTYGKFPQDSE